MSVTFPPKITGAQLKSLARLCGTTRTGTKAAIQERIVDGLKDFQPLAPGTRVLSIDLGIRNLAYSLLEVPGGGDVSPDPGPKKRRGKRQEAVPPTSAEPILHAWERLALIPKTPKPAKPKKKSKTAVEQPDAADSPTTTTTTTTAAAKPKRRTKKAAEAALEESDEAAADPPPTPLPAEDFSPARLSLLAIDLVAERLLPLRPHVVLMEQQRFRSMGGAAVLEWTLRVNSLECMLYAVFATMRALGRWPGGRLEGVVARSVLEFMAVQEGATTGTAAGGGDGDGDGGGSGEVGMMMDIWDKKKKGDNKKVKKDIVGRMLQSRDGVRIAEGAVAVEETAREYLEKWERMGKRGKAGANVKKMDDLADCLLQGITFIRWQDNKRKLLAGGVDALEDQMLAG